jgi:hypothetical protein
MVSAGKVAARERITDILQRAACPPEAFAGAKCIRTHARVVLHFHPDRIGTKAITVAEALVAEGEYRNQFETGLSSGSVTAFPGGARDNWERTLFGGAYHQDAVTGGERPKCGSLELVRFPDGPIPRFGSCYLGCIRLSRIGRPSRSWAARTRSRQNGWARSVG